MGYIVLEIITVILAVAGFVEILKTLVLAIYKKPAKNAMMVIIPDISECNNPEYFLRSYAESIKWMGNLRPKKIICIADNMTFEGKRIANLACKEYDFMELITTDELYKILNQNIGKKIVN